MRENSPPGSVVPRTRLSRALSVALALGVLPCVASAAQAVQPVTPTLHHGMHVMLLIPVLIVAAALLLVAYLLWRQGLLRRDVRELRRERKRLIAVQQMSGIGYWEHDLTSDVLTWSDVSCRLLDIAPGDFDGRPETFLQRVHPEDRPRFQVVHARAAEGQPLDIRYRVRRAGGGERTIDAHGELVVRGDGRRVLQGTMRDVTDLVDAGVREQRQAEQYRYLFEYNPVPMAVYDRGTLAVLAANRAAQDMVGYAREQLLALRAQEVLVESERARFAQHIAMAGAEHTDAGVYLVRRREGEPLRCHIFGQDILFDGHRARMVMLLDVTTAEKAREELEASENRLRLAARASHDAIWDLDIAAGTLWWNEGYTALFGYDSEHSTPRLQDWAEHIHPDDRARVEASFATALNSGLDQWQADYRYRCSDGRYLDVRDRGYLLRDAAGHPVRMVGGMHDRSHEVSAQRDLERRERNHRALVELMPAPLLVLKDGRVQTANAAAAAMLKAKTPEDLHGISAERLFEPAAAAACRAPSGAAQQTLASKVNRLDGGSIEGQLLVADLRDSEVGGVQVLLRDLGAEHRMARAEQERVAFFRLSADGFGILDAQMHIIEANAALRRQFGLGADGAMSGLAELLDAERCERVRAAWSGLAVGDATETIECRLRGREEETWVELGFVRARSDTWYMVARDISRQVRAEAEARLLQRAVESVENGVVISDARAADTPLVYVNPAFSRITGYPADTVLGRNPRFLYRDDAEQPALRELAQAMQEGHPASVVLRNYRRDGGLFWNRLRMAPVRDARGLSHWVGIQQDITEERRAETRLQRQVLTDELTGLPNRRALLESAATLLQREPLALVHLGLDQFKLINDALGHASGDELLRNLGARLRAALPGAVLLSRFGGDEFVALVPRATAQLERVLERITESVRRPIELQGTVQQLNCSVGVAMAPEHGDSAETLMRSADAAMHEAKRQGRNRIVIFSADLHQAASQRLAVISRLRGRDLSQELALHYQSIHDGASGAVVGAELLLRWPGGPDGLTSPDVLVPLLEESGLILPVGRWVLNEACRRQRELQSLSPSGCKVALNVSTQQLMFGDFVREVREALAGSGAEPALLELEITESALMADPAKAEEILQQLKRMGLGIAIDDFGTGYSSLGYLHRLSVDKLKIDRSFVRDVLTDHDDALICGSIIQLAHSLGLRVVAEGVESAEQRAWLAERGCEQMQGYHFARPKAFASA